MEIEISKIGERGQIVIPLEMRDELQLKKGEKIVIAKENNKLVLEPMKYLKSRTIEKLREDLIDLKIAESRWEQFKKGKVIRQSKEDFLKDIEKW